MIYLSAFTFPGQEEEYDFIFDLRTTYDQSLYPFQVLPKAGLERIDFKPVTILCGGNGSGKSTALNVIAEKLSLQRTSPCNRTRFFEKYVSMCHADMEAPVPPASRIITSDDVFDMMLDIRSLNDGIGRRRETLAEDYYALRREPFQMRSLEDLDKLRQVNRARKSTLSRFVEGEGGRTLRERSNGESALMVFRQRMDMDCLCLLDEPENSLSPENQLALADFLAEAARYCGNQLIISTHSPFLLALPGARIIDLDNGANLVDNWTQLKNPRVYYDFFKKHEAEFED